jgi:hypothetical protein
VSLRDVLRRKRERRRRAENQTLSEDDVQRLQHAQRAARTSVRVLRRDQ